MNAEILRKKGVQIGKDCRIYSTKFGSEPYLIKIGENVTISNDVQFITHDGGVHVLRKKLGNIDLVGTIKIEDNVFIGANTIILPNVVIGKNVIVGAGSIVTKSIPENSIAVGNPVKIIRTLDDYCEKVKNKTIKTYGMNQRDKKEYLIKLFGEM